MGQRLYFSIRNLAEVPIRISFEGPKGRSSQLEPGGSGGYLVPADRKEHLLPYYAEDVFNSWEGRWTLYHQLDTGEKKGPWDWVKTQWEFTKGSQVPDSRYAAWLMTFDYEHPHLRASREAWHYLGEVDKVWEDEKGVHVTKRK